MPLTLKIIRMDKELPMPVFARPGDAAFDLCTREKITINPGERAQVKTGLKLEIPDGFAGFVWDRGGVSQKGGLKTLGGVVDSGYRGEIMVGLVNLSKEPYVFEKGNRVAQMCIQKCENVTIVEVGDSELSDTSRGEKGFGSTGK